MLDSEAHDRIRTLNSSCGGAVAGIVTKTLVEQGAGLAKILGRRISTSTQEVIFSASKTYVKKYTERHGILKVLGMKEPVSLESVYTYVRLLNERNVLKFADSDDGS